MKKFAVDGELFDGRQSHATGALHAAICIPSPIQPLTASLQSALPALLVCSQLTLLERNSALGDDDGGDDVSTTCYFYCSLGPQRER